MNVKIKTGAWQAAVAARILKSQNVALVLGGTIYLWGVCRDCFLENEEWVKHELVHIAQFKKYGRLKFAFLYLAASFKKGYYQNKFEVEAREGEKVKTDLSTIQFT